MSLLAEVVVEEWLNRQGYFTIRGVKLGNHEIDILAIRLLENETIERRHIEVQVSVRPISYICHLPRKIQKATGRPATTAKRNDVELVEGVKEWVEKKYRNPNKLRLITSLGGGEWTEELIVHNVKHEKELDLIASHGIKIQRLTDVVRELQSSKMPVKAASGSDLLELMHLSLTHDPVISEALTAVTEANSK